MEQLEPKREGTAERGTEKGKELSREMEQWTEGSKKAKDGKIPMGSTTP